VKEGDYSGSIARVFKEALRNERYSPSGDRLVEGCTKPVEVFVKTPGLSLSKSSKESLDT